MLTQVSDHTWICISWLVFLSHASPLHPSISCRCMPMVDIVVQTGENEIENIDLLIKVWPLCSHGELSWTGLIVTLVGLSAPLSFIDLSYRRPFFHVGMVSTAIRTLDYVLLFSILTKFLKHWESLPSYLYPIAHRLPSTCEGPRVKNWSIVIDWPTSWVCMLNFSFMLSLATVSGLLFHLL